MRIATAAGVTPEMRAACLSVAGWMDVSFSRISCDRPGISQPPCGPEGGLRLLAVCCSRHTRVPPSIAVTVRTVPSSCPACARAAQSGWPRAVACPPTPGLPGSTRLRSACCRHGALPAAWRGGRAASRGFTTSRGHTPWNCGTIALKFWLASDSS
jgi:hypothetical protein